MPMINAFATPKAKLIALARRLCADRKGNVLIIMGFAIIPLTFAVGFGVDYSRAERLRTQLNAAADAAALVAVDPSMIKQDGQLVAKPAAYGMFASQAAKIPGLASPPNVTVNVTDNIASAVLTQRTVTVTYTAVSQNVFGGVLGVNTLPVNGSASATASQVPNINFYVMLDTSPSMLLPTTSAGIAAMTNAMSPGSQNVARFTPDPRSPLGQRGFYPSSYVGTAWGSGCAFACHEQRPDAYGEPNSFIDSNGNSILISKDYYARDYTQNPTDGVYVFGVTKNGADDLFDLSGNVVGRSSVYYNTGYTVLNGGTSNATYVFSGNAGHLSTWQGRSQNDIEVNFADPFWVAENYGLLYPNSGINKIELRIDAETTAAENLITFAQNEETKLSNVAYQMQFYQFNYGDPAAITTSMRDVSQMNSTDISPPNGTFAPYVFNGGYYTSSDTVTKDEDTNFTRMLSVMNNTMPTPGNGSGASGDSPQEILFIVTDGMTDISQSLTGSSVPASGYCPIFSGESDRICSALTSDEIAECNVIKARGIKIAILYTEYSPDVLTSSNIPWSFPIANNIVPDIKGQLQACSTKNPDGTYLMQTVTTDQNISDALNQLFAIVTQSAHLIR